MPNPPLDDDERYAKVLIGEVGKLSGQLGAVREQVKEDVAQLLRSYREDNHRAILGIHVRIVSLEDTIETDRAARIARQKQLDAMLAGIQANQRFWIRMGVLFAFVAIGIVMGIWLF